MADKLDILLGEYMTGMLQVKIHSREKWIARNNKEEIVKNRNSAPITSQEVRLLINEPDLILQKLIYQKEVLDELMEVISGTTIKQIITSRFKHRLTWVNVGKRVCLEESTVRKQYSKFKKTLRNELFPPTAQ